MNPYWSYLLTAVGVFGLWLAGRKNLWGWAVGLGAQLLWVAYAYFTGQPGFYLSAIAYGTVYARNLRRWALERRKEREAAERYRRVVTSPLPTERALHIYESLRDRSECQASISGLCRNQTEGFEPCDMDEGECIHRTFRKP